MRTPLSSLTHPPEHRALGKLCTREKKRCDNSDDEHENACYMLGHEQTADAEKHESERLDKVNAIGGL